MGDEATAQGNLIAGDGKEFVDAGCKGIACVGEVLVEVGLHDVCGASLAHQVKEAVSFQGEFYPAFVPDVFHGDVGGADIRQHCVCGHGVVGDVAAGSEAHRFKRCSGFFGASCIQASFSVKEQDVREAHHAVVGVSIRVGVPKRRFLSSVVEILLGVVQVGHAGGVQCEDTAVAHDVTFLENRGGQAGISVLKFVHQILGGEVEPVSVELATGALEDIGESAFELLSPIATGGVHVLDLPDGARPVLSEFSEDVAILRIQAVFAFSDEVAGYLIAIFPLAQEGVNLGH